ncbi:MAG: NADH:ubiquinone reductase (Na(+)-transporting) subunit C [Calditrichaeota bacterium]|nr:MAG: NADH:ubiquinone reductase (Na(+)-transporting) subunit C [Calditrichota bacterium]MBL1206840.1 NADH:ubiquinone reductase (Na(+)-transporting) subunit C [Calditrichota bacterium]NOG46667.1 NADH:ubiquinone reductase (Na(+)-transporting) subunit C [Calditrichota bacterium]
MHSDFQTFRFAIIITLVCSLLLATAATFLKPRQVENVKLDIKKNILKSAGITDPNTELSREDIQSLYEKNIAESVINDQGASVEGKSPSDINPKANEGLMALYQWKDGEAVKAYIIPISGKGLWSTIYGYLAIEPDGATVKGITFYQHGETPGLGGEIEKSWFTDSYIGKRIINPQGELVSVTSVRGKIKDKVPESEFYHNVDGISGATLTTRGVNDFLKEDLEAYESYFKIVREAQKEVDNG